VISFGGVYIKIGGLNKLFASPLMISTGNLCSTILCGQRLQRPAVFGKVETAVPIPVSTANSDALNACHNRTDSNLHSLNRSSLVVEYNILVKVSQLEYLAY
jgi:hypothetical protein